MIRTFVDCVGSNWHAAVSLARIMNMNETSCCLKHHNCKFTIKTLTCARSRRLKVD